MQHATCAGKKGEGQAWQGNPHKDGAAHNIPYLGWIDDKAFYKDVPGPDDPEPPLEWFQERHRALQALNMGWEDYWPPAIEM